MKQNTALVGSVLCPQWQIQIDLKNGNRVGEAVKRILIGLLTASGVQSIVMTGSTVTCIAWPMQPDMVLE